MPSTLTFVPDPDVAAQSLADVLPDGVVIADADQRVTLVSAPAARMLGLDAEASLGRPVGEVLRLQDQDGQDWCSCNTPYVGLSTRTGIPEQSWLLPDGTEVLVAARVLRGPAPAGRSPGWRSRCGPAAGGPGSTASAPTWSPRWPTSSARR